MRVVISGPPGAGKSFLAQSLSKKFDLKVVHASHILKKLFEEGVDEKVNTASTKASEGFWETEKGSDFVKERLKNAKFDIALDKKLLEILEKEENVVFDSRTLPWLSQPLQKKGVKIFCVWLDAGEKTRAKRITSRDQDKKIKDLIPEEVQETHEKMISRYEDDKIIYKKIYDFDLGEDFSVFDLNLDTDELTKKEVAELVSKKLQEFMKKKKIKNSAKA